ncbi:signal peptidase II [Erysipelothrix rhusiopathiae]|uniref:signal peptidase II n=1 Tax=Erysipelothrix sp. strain 2 (EsS2-7-Brazil) TaxID=2500579 RepID=UPI001378F210|nr:signal peptidase II [Erysipelothrix sp. strain 2 (EsS2-7-Brazil)]MBK2404338.1 signal peptidase II [Erysipelothrix sp. strain 2 (EsS2-7-Brazil)]NBA01640.1 signal peptidase II [Erysipelothrix rhusiopathiae]
MKTVLWVFGFLLVDQGSKYYVASTLNQSTLYLWGDSLQIHPQINTDLSWINHFLKDTFNLSISAHFMLMMRVFILLMIVMYLIYHVGIDNRRLDSHYRISIALILSATLASILDQTLWGGSFDWIQYTTQSLTQFSFDLKDLFLDLGLLSLVGAMLINHEGRLSEIIFLRKWVN